MCAAHGYISLDMKPFPLQSVAVPCNRKDISVHLISTEIQSIPHQPHRVHKMFHQVHFVERRCRLVDDMQSSAHDSRGTKDCQTNLTKDQNGCYRIDIGLFFFILVSRIRLDLRRARTAISSKEIATSENNSASFVALNQSIPIASQYRLAIESRHVDKALALSERRVPLWDGSARIETRSPPVWQSAPDIPCCHESSGGK